jgi:hypothetical protein
MLEDDDSYIYIKLVNEKSNHPDVWITPWSGTTPYASMWKVKCIWAL